MPSTWSISSSQICRSAKGSTNTDSLITMVIISTTSSQGGVAEAVRVSITSPVSSSAGMYVGLIELALINVPFPLEIQVSDCAFVASASATRYESFLQITAFSPAKAFTILDMFNVI